MEQAAQADGEVRIGAMTWYQGNPSMPDAAAAERGLVRVHGPRDRTSSPPREQCSREIRFVVRTFLSGEPGGWSWGTGNRGGSVPKTPLNVSKQTVVAAVTSNAPISRTTLKVRRRNTLLTQHTLGPEAVYSEARV